MSNFEMPLWSVWLMWIGLFIYIAFIIYYVIKNRGLKRPVFAFPYVLWIAVFTIVPALLVAYFALTDASGHFTLDNLFDFWDSNYIIRNSLSEDEILEITSAGLTVEEFYPRGLTNINALVLSIFLAMLCTIICLLLGYPIAHILADREFKLGSTLIVLFIVPMWMNFILRTYALSQLLDKNGLINTLLERMGLGKQSLTNSESAILLGMVYNFLPFMVFPIYNSLNKMDPKLSEAAMDLGCNKWRTFYKVTLPLSVPGVVSGITMVFMPAVTTFSISRMLGGSKVQLFGDLIERKFMMNQDAWNVGSALSLVMMVLILLSLGLLQKVDPKGEGGTTV